MLSGGDFISAILKVFNLCTVKKQFKVTHREKNGRQAKSVTLRWGSQVRSVTGT